MQIEYKWYFFPLVISYKTRDQTLLLRRLDFQLTRGLMLPTVRWVTSRLFPGGKLKGRKHPRKERPTYTHVWSLQAWGQADPGGSESELNQS